MTVHASGDSELPWDDVAAVPEALWRTEFVCRFDADGRCREFTEYYMRERPEALPE